MMVGDESVRWWWFLYLGGCLTYMVARFWLW